MAADPQAGGDLVPGVEVGVGGGYCGHRDPLFLLWWTGACLLYQIDSILSIAGARQSRTCDDGAAAALALPALLARDSRRTPRGGAEPDVLEGRQRRFDLFERKRHAFAQGDGRGVVIDSDR